MSLFCCSNIQPYRPRPLQHEAKFSAFVQWAAFPRESEAQTYAKDSKKLTGLGNPYVIQLVRQINYGALESKRYFALQDEAANCFTEITEEDLIEANFEKLNTYKNFKCVSHNRFFEVNVYEKDPTNSHHWRHNIARPAGEIDC